MGAAETVKTAAVAGDLDRGQADPAPAAPDVQLIELERIDDSPSNPRKAFVDLQELADDVRRRGVLQPVLVRPAGERYELVFGTRRFRAARLAGVGAIPATVRSMTDAEVLEPHLIEHARRPTSTRSTRRTAPARSTSRTGLPSRRSRRARGRARPYLYARLTLCALGPAGRKAVLDGRLTPSTALLIARIPDATLQAEATEAITNPRFGGEPTSDPPLSAGVGARRRWRSGWYRL